MDQRQIPHGRRRSDSVTWNITGILLLLVAAMFGVYLPIAIDMIVNLVESLLWADQDNTPDNALWPLLFVATVAGALGGYAIKNMRWKKTPAWTGPVVGFNLTFGIYMVLAVAWVGHTVYWATLVMFGAMMLLVGGMALLKSFKLESLPHPGMALD